MKNFLILVLSLGFFFPFVASAACSPVALGGTGNCTFTVSDILFGNGTSPIATSSAFTFATGASRLTVTNASTTNINISNKLWLTNLGTPAGTFLAVDQNGLVIATSTPAAGTGTVTNIATTWPITGGPITTTGTLTFGWATTSQPSSSNVFVSNGAAGFYGVATSSETCSAPLLCASFNHIGAGGAISWTGLATTSQPSSSNVLVSNGGAGVYGVATSSQTCTWPLACTTFNHIGSGGAITWSGFSTSTTPIANQVAFWSSSSALAGNSAFTFMTSGNTLLTVTNASTTNITVSQSQFNTYSGVTGRISPLVGFVLSTGTTTTWTATTSGAYVPSLVMPFAGTLLNTICQATTTAAFLGIAPRVNTTATAPSYFVASTTKGTITFTGSNTFAAGDTISIYAGTTTTASTATGVTCTFQAYQTS